ncbi:Hpt domain-containing protein [Bacteroidales bacterium]|nr:Hpt domain-containing protein [Bacteroidales bacterium]
MPKQNKALISTIKISKQMKVNLDYLKDMSAGNTELVKEIIEIFCEQTTQIQENMLTSIKTEEWPGLAQLAHKAKASVVMMGMEETALSLKQLETLAKEEKKTEIYAEIVDNFITDTNNIIKELKIIQHEPEKYI